MVNVYALLAPAFKRGPGLEESEGGRAGFHCLSHSGRTSGKSLRIASTSLQRGPGLEELEGGRARVGTCSGFVAK